MKQTLQLTPQDETVRTQITLTKNLKQLIEQQIKPQNISLAEYLRQAAILKLYLDRQQNTDLHALSDEVLGSLDLHNYPDWQTEDKIKQWQKQSRQTWDKK